MKGPISLPTKRSLRTSDPLKILVIRFKYIGDVLLTSVICNTLKESFPYATVDFLMHEAAAELFANHPYIDTVIALTREQQKNPIAYWQVLRQISSRRYDLIVDAQSTAKSELVSLFAGRQAVRIGRKKPFRGISYTHATESRAATDNKIEERLNLLKPLERYGITLKRNDQMCVAVHRDAQAYYRLELLKRGVDFQRPLFAVSISAKLDYKKWQFEHFNLVVEHCVNHYNAQIVLTAGGPGERIDARAFASQYPQRDRLSYYLETVELRQLAAFFSLCSLYIGNEGGPRHIAQAAGIPTVSVFSPSAKKVEWLPAKSPLHRGIEWDDLSSLSVEDKAQIHKNLDIGSHEYYALYHSITSESVIALVDEVCVAAEINHV